MSTTRDTPGQDDPFVRQMVRAWEPRIEDDDGQTPSRPAYSRSSSRSTKRRSATGHGGRQ